MKATGGGEPKLLGLKFCKPILRFLGALHAHEKHPNRSLHFDQLTVLLLMAYFDPARATLREIVETSKLKRVQKALNVRPTSLGSVSEASHVFDPELLRQIFLELAGEACAIDAVPHPRQVPKEMMISIVDGTLWTALPRMYKALAQEGPRSGRKPGFMLQLHFDLCRGVPTGAVVDDAFASEKQLLGEALAKDTLYVVDRGYMRFDLLQSILDKGSSFLIRGKGDTVHRLRRELPISDAARKAGVYWDAEVAVGSEPHAEKIKQPLRMIRARCQLPAQHNLIPGGRHPAADRTGMVDLILLTDRMDWDADLLLELYAHRWKIELFFRWFKHVLGCRHFIFESENGFALQVYAALIGALLVVLYTGRKPNLAVMRAIQHYMSGWATYAEFKTMIKKERPALP